MSELSSVRSPAELSPPGGAPRGHWRLVAGKELADLLGRLGRKPLTRTVGVVLLFGLLVPQSLPGVANLPAFFALFMSFLPTRLVAIESLAGERERGTLEPLLASPLSDADIAVGKIAAATVYGAARGWLFVAVWLPGALAARATGLSEAPIPSMGVLLMALAGSAVVAYATAVFGVWQSARAPSVRAIGESGGLLRLVIIVSVFFVGPWLLGLLSPTGQAPELPVPGSGQVMSLEAVRDAAAASPAAFALLGALVVVGAGAWLWWLTAAAMRRCRRESLIVVDS